MHFTHALRTRLRDAVASSELSSYAHMFQAEGMACVRGSSLLSRSQKRWLSNAPTNASTPPSKFSDRLSGRTCMVTGGTSGIGFTIAERFLQEGADHIVLVGRSYERLVKAASRLQPSALGDTSAATPASGHSANGEVAIKAPEADQQAQDQGTTKPQGTLIESSSRVSLLIGDVSEASTWLRQLEKAMDPVDILVNAAGISTSNILAKLEPDEISRVLRTNLEGSILTSRALVRASIRSRMKRRGSVDAAAVRSKCIINISSLLAVKGGTGAVPYAASKAGILGLTRSLTVETANSLKDIVIRSNAILPGYIETPMIADFSEGETSRLKDSIPLRRFGTPDEIADAAVFLAGNEYANNCVLNLDGGLSAL